MKVEEETSLFLLSQEMKFLNSYFVAVTISHLMGLSRESDTSIANHK